MKKIKEDELMQLVKEGDNQANKLTKADGFRFEETPGHGYVRTSKSITEKIPEYMRTTKFSRAGRYEEDCDWCLPVVVQRHLFSKEIQLLALKTLYHWHPESFRRFFNLYPVDSFKIKELKEKLEKQKRDRWADRYTDAAGQTFSDADPGL